MGPRASSQIDRVIRETAVTQLGLITAAQAEASGVVAQQLANRRSSGMLVPVFRGVMRLAGVEPRLCRPLAAALAVPGSCIAGPTAGMILGLPVGKSFADDSASVVLTVPNSVVVRINGVVTVRLNRSLPSRPYVAGVRISTPAAVVVLLPRFVDASTVERCIDHCLVHRLVTVVSVRKLIESLPKQSVTGRRLLLDLLADRADGVGHRSKQEQVVARWLTEAGLTGWRRNLVVVTSDGLRVEIDFAWPHLKVALEVSPFFTHGSRKKQERDVERRQLLIQMGWTVVEATDSHLVDRESFQKVVRILRNFVQ